MPPLTLTTALGEFASMSRRETIPDAAVATATVGIVDCFGVMLAGRLEPVTRTVTEIFPSTGTESSVLLTGRADGPTAALINGVAAHALDFDDVASQGHMSAVLVPALLAEAEALGRSGSDMLTAYVVGYEVWSELVLREPDQYHRKGWHPTGVFGPVAAAAACANLRKLPPEQASHALAIAASQGGGLVANFGTMTKPFHVGRAAQAGVLAARLAEVGMTGAPDALEGTMGLLAAVSPLGRADRTTPRSADWHILQRGLTIKSFPTCLSTHRGIQGVIQLRQEHGFVPENVASVTVTMSRRNAELLHYPRPQSALEGKFSIEFAVAAALIFGQLTLLELTDETVLRADVQKLLTHVHLAHSALEDAVTGYAPTDEVVVSLKDGAQCRCDIGAVIGSPSLPLGQEKIWQKFSTCVERSGAAIPARRLFEVLWHLDEITDVRRLPNL